jgi:hypothetical protein
MRQILLAALFAPFAFGAPTFAAPAERATHNAATPAPPADPRSFSAYGEGAPRAVSPERPASGWRPEGAEWPQLP